MNLLAHSRRMRRLLLPLALAAGLSGGCDRRDDLDGRRRAIPGLAPAGQAVGGGDEGEKVLAFDFIDNRAAALVYSEGALVASGRGIAFALVSRGGGPAQWRLGSGAQPSARVDGQVAHVYFPFDRDPGGISAAGTIPIAMRFRPSTKSQLASVFLNDTKVGDIPMNEVGTAEYRIDVPAAHFAVGENNLRLFFRSAIVVDGLRTAGAIERLAIGKSTASATAPVRAVAVTHGGLRQQALSSSESARISFYLQVPTDRPRLTLKVAGGGAAEVRVARDGAPAKELWRVTSKADEWTNATVDLVDHKGALVRIDLVGRGPLDWARPQVWSAPSSTPSPAATAAAPHVILWIVSGLRADALAEGGPMPALGEIAKSGASFPAIARAPAASLAAAEILTGHSIASPTIAPAEQTLAERFREAGYETTLYSNAPAIAGDGQGFDRQVRSGQMDAAALWARAHTDLKANAGVRTLSVLWVNEGALPWSPDAALLAPQWRSYVGRVVPASTAWLSSRSRNGTVIAPRDRQYLGALYRAELAAVDGALATMVADIGALGLKNDAALIVVGDRGQELFEDVGFGDPRGLEVAGRAVPLVARAPGREPIGSTAPRLVVTADAFATALDVAQISMPLSSDGLSVMVAPSPVRALLLKNPGRARGIATATATWIEPTRGPAALYKRDSEGGERAVSAEANTVTTRALIQWMSLLGAIDTWDSRRWGLVTAMRPAFAAEHGGF